MNETSTTARSTGSGSVAAVERAGVDALHRHDPRVGAEPLGELARSRRRRRRRGVAPRCEQDVGEAAGRGADVERDPSPPGRSRTRRAPPSSLCAPRLTHWRPPATSIGASTAHEIAALAVAPRGVALAHADLAREHERLGAGARLGEAALHEELVEAHPARRRRGHAPIVAQPAHRGRMPERGVTRATGSTARNAQREAGEHRDAVRVGEHQTRGRRSPPHADRPGSTPGSGTPTRARPASEVARANVAAELPAPGCGTRNAAATPNTSCATTRMRTARPKKFPIARTPTGATTARI